MRREVQKEWYEYDFKKCKPMLQVLYKRLEKINKKISFFYPLYGNVVGIK